MYPQQLILHRNFCKIGISRRSHQLRLLNQICMPPLHHLHTVQYHTTACRRMYTTHGQANLAGQHRLPWQRHADKHASPCSQIILVSHLHSMQRQHAFHYTQISYVCTAYSISRGRCAGARTHTVRIAEGQNMMFLVAASYSKVPYLERCPKVPRTVTGTSPWARNSCT